jgi:very-short-patch-repair endonuclease
MAWQRIGAELYRWSGLIDDPWQVLNAWKESLPPEAVFSGATAAWILGLDFPPTDPVQIVVPPDSGLRTRPGLSVRRCQIAASDTITVRGLRTLALHRALRDLCLRWPEVEALVAIDMALCGRLTDTTALRRYAETAAGRPGAKRLRRLAALAAPAESPMETRLRWLLLKRGLPRPEVQANLRDEEDQLLGRADLYYRAARLIVEYDGANHRDRLVEDDRRQNRLLSVGFGLLRFTAGDIHNQPDLVEALVRGALAGSTRFRPFGANGASPNKNSVPLALPGRYSAAP